MPGLNFSDATFGQLDCYKCSFHPDIRNFSLSNGIEKAGETESDPAETVTKRSVHPARPLTFGTVTDLHAFFLDPNHQLRGTLA